MPWWRVLRADGTPAPHLAARVIAHLRAENVPLTPDGARVVMRLARWAPGDGLEDAREPDEN